MKKTTYTNYFYLLPALVFVGMFLIVGNRNIICLMYVSYLGVLKRLPLKHSFIEIGFICSLITYKYTKLPSKFTSTGEGLV